MDQRPDLLALDFDGVICDGLLEYFQTAWQAYGELWMAGEKLAPPVGLADRFYRLRPIVESGWEMPLVIRAILQGRSDREMFAGWPAIAQTLLAQEPVSRQALGAAVDQIRDQWIATDLGNWLALHQFYPGVIKQLRRILDSSTTMVIITTKEGRFVQQLLQQQGIQLPAQQIYGKATRQPKAETLKQLLAPAASSGIWFVEDRLPTLQTIRSLPELASLGLYLANWGYNTETERQAAAQAPGINLLSLEQFAQDFSAWSP